jgi:hypothetical protein
MQQVLNDVSDKIRALELLNIFKFSVFFYKSSLIVFNKFEFLPSQWLSTRIFCRYVRSFYKGKDII